MKRCALAIAITLLTTGCLAGLGPRDPGPHEKEHGEVFYWEVTSSDVAFTECTDAADWQSDIQPPEFEENSFLLYELSEDGETATAQDCETTDASTCEDADPPLEFEVDGSTLTYDPEPRAQSALSQNCTMMVDELWTMTDRGDTLTLDTDLQFSLEGDEGECQTLDEAIQEEGSNEHGIDGCLVTLTIDTEYYNSGAK